MFIEKRKAPRLSDKYNAQLLISDDKKIKVPIRIVDLSLGGARFESAYGLKNGDNAKILIQLDEKVNLVREGSIVWIKELTEGAQYGIEFIMDELSEKTLLENYIAAKLKQFSNISHNEKRKYPRVALDTAVVYIKRKDISEEHKGYIENISLNGMSLSSKEDFLLDEVITFAFPFTKDIYFNLNGVIMRKLKKSDFHSYGIVFETDPDESKPRLIKLYISNKKNSQA